MQCVRELESREEYDTLSAHEGVTVEWFTASWCGPCKNLAEKLTDEVLPSLSEDDRKKLIMHKIDVSLHADLAKEQGIQSVPHLIMYHQGKSNLHTVATGNPRVVADALRQMLATADP